MSWNGARQVVFRPEAFSQALVRDYPPMGRKCQGDRMPTLSSPAAGSDRRTRPEQVGARSSLGTGWLPFSVRVMRVFVAVNDRRIYTTATIGCTR
jgi:hypothetical protein